ncbi:MAG: phenylalanine--tRNA ligase subunit alpha [Thaumarchaeota archaeon]|nr:phenylalanine--tRNA ligase subunit alpha [Candidatus Geocrenenecus arthurdayi]MCL7390623.1 phenylalanine--tRNA ligase subunit alpha [Candidatus Geocrenenecus arthurdayi]MCL7395876.1 phenylalanine--tRNA ligase subunit alpha [Candidatus Geocrenenecus arthurdayi]MCL7403330.1 phenylalanine--tRNA ligase subunit alpha [Candidatus Geocrenenecus arthurdayi]
MLHWLEKNLIKILRRIDKPLSFEEAANLLNRDVGTVAKTVQWLREKELLEVETRTIHFVSLGPEGEAYSLEGLPERRLVDRLSDLGGVVNIEELRKSLEENIFKIGLLWAKKNGWIQIEARNSEKFIKLIYYPPETNEEKILKQLREKKTIEFESLDEDLKKACLNLKSRQSVIEIEEIKKYYIRLTEKALRIPQEELEVEEITRLTQDMLISGSWRQYRFSKFNVSAPSKPVYTGKRHPLQRLIKIVKEIFVEMGFEEIRGPVVELAFWNFDALFQPQDHPARDMHDTFYLDQPRIGQLPENLVEKIKNVHEKGGSTGSLGWRYLWKREEAEKLVLRTHTTATTIRYLAEHPDPPIKVFSVDRIYRNEKVDWKHLAEFHQIEGIVMDKGVCFRDLIGLIREFYSRLGLKDVKFRPSYFPYTEPSAEAIVYLREKNTWLELIGMGIFRPEVTQPLGVKYPVLAWGGGLERLALALYDLEDIRTFYFNDLRWIRSISNIYLEKKIGMM